MVLDLANIKSKLNANFSNHHGKYKILNNNIIEQGVKQQFLCYSL